MSKKIAPPGLSVTGGRGNKVEGNVIIGRGIEVRNESHTIISGNTVVSAEVMALLLRAKTEVEAANAPEAVKKNLSARLLETQHSLGRSALMSNYSALMAAVADHAQVIGPFVPAILAKIGALIG